LCQDKKVCGVWGKAPRFHDKRKPVRLLADFGTCPVVLAPKGRNMQQGAQPLVWSERFLQALKGRNSFETKVWSVWKQEPLGAKQPSPGQSLGFFGDHGSFGDVSSGRSKA